MRCCAPPATNFFDGMAGNIAGIDARLSPDLTGRRHRAISGGRKPLARVAIRHTVGLDDTIEGEGGVADAQRECRRALFQAQAVAAIPTPMRRG